MASAPDSPKKRVSWTPVLNQQVSGLENRLQKRPPRISTNDYTIQLFIALINTLEPSAIDYAKIAEKLGEGNKSP